MLSAFTVAGSAFIFGYFNPLAAFLGSGAIATGTEVFLGAFVGCMLDNIIFHDSISTGSSLALGLYGLIGAVISSYLAAYFGFQQILGAALGGALTVFLCAIRSGPVSGILNINAM